MFSPARLFSAHRGSDAFRALTCGVAVGALAMLLTSCAADGTGSGAAVTTSRSGALPSDTASPTSPAGTPMMGAGAGSSMGSNGLGGGRGSF